MRPATRQLVLAVALAALGASLCVFSEATLRAGAGSQATAGVSPDLRAEFERWWDAQPRIPIPVSGDGARVVIVKFTDLRCPSCGVSYFAMKTILARFQAQFPGAVKLITKDYPLEPACNSDVRQPIHPAACDAAAAVRMARSQGKGVALEEWFYTNQSAISPVSVRQAANSIGGITNFEAGLAAAMAGIRTDVGLARLLGVNSTPTYFINGVRCQDRGQPLTPQFLEIAIARELRKTAK